jgi:hypothetical protein
MFTLPEGAAPWPRPVGVRFQLLACAMSWMGRWYSVVRCRGGVVETWRDRDVVADAHYSVVAGFAGAFHLVVARALMEWEVEVGWVC